MGGREGESGRDCIWLLVCLNATMALNFMRFVIFYSVAKISFSNICMQSNFGGHGHSGFGDFACLQKRPNFPFGPWTIVHGSQKI